MRCPQRIDVDKWGLYVPDGITRKGLLGNIPIKELRKAAFEINKDCFDAIRKALLSEQLPYVSAKGTHKEVIPEEICTPELFVEGATHTITVSAYERNLAARKACIEHYGYVCAVCKHSLDDLYGSIAKGMVHVHHLTNVATIGKTYKVDPVADLRPVCPNCHAVLHRKTPALSIEELRSILAKHLQH